ncbi:MAG: beta-galactosidase GalA [Gemmatimonadaceae bacterium]
MSIWSRRDVLQAGLAAAGALVTPLPIRQLVASAADPFRGDDSSPLPAPGSRERLLLDFGWRFHLGHATDPAQDFGYGQGRMLAKSGELFAPSRPDFDVTGWRALDLPHDWAVELPFEHVAELTEFGSKPLGRAYPATSIGWYRRAFDISASDAGRRLSLEFDGVFRDCTVALNGHLLGRNASGYSPFRYDITDYASYGERNVLVVRVDATGREGWFYEGAGIYRHVWLVKTPAVHVAHWGTCVTTPRVKRDTATVAVTTDIDNDADREVSCRVVSTILDATGRAIAVTRSGALRIAARTRGRVDHQLTVTSPRLWSPETPYLYTLVTTIESGGPDPDRYETPFGIRTLRFDPDRGLFLNGARIVLKGTCNHQDHAGVGAALPDRLQSYRIEKLRAMGSNAYRTAHNPPAPELLDACDRLGMLVLDETRLFASTEEGYSQLERLIRRDRNRPSVFCWSIANEEWHVQGTKRGARIASSMKRLVRRLDPSRPVTMAMDGEWGGPMAAVADVMGFNYERPSNPETNLDHYRARFPTRPSMGTEVASTYATRGIYVTDRERGYISAYDVNKPSYGATAEQWWTRYAARPHLAGGFVWTGFDYRGEPSPYEWPCISSHFGIMDTCGFPKDNFFYYQAWWGHDPVLHLFPHWNWSGREGQDIEVWVHTNLDRVELFLNGRSVGEREVPRNAHVGWTVPFAPGTLEARAARAGSTPLIVRRETTGPAARVAIRADRERLAADGEDVAILEVSVVDGRGLVVPVADNSITFRVTGAGTLIGVGNGDPSSHESDKGNSRRAFNGLCMAIVRSTKDPGELRVEATSPGLASATVAIACTPATPRATA